MCRLKKDFLRGKSQAGAGSVKSEKHHLLRKQDSVANPPFLIVSNSLAECQSQDNCFAVVAESSSSVALLGFRVQRVSMAKASGSRYSVTFRFSPHARISLCMIGLAIYNSATYSND